MMTNTLVKLLYFVVVGGLALYGWLGLITLYLYWRHRGNDPSAPTYPSSVLPPVTVQLPLYNEKFVVDSLIHSAANLQYPRDRLEIQVLDDSTDDTTARVEALVAHYRSQGINISLLHRTHRRGYKAGALNEGMEAALGEFVAVFDADFQPPPDFLYRTIPYFLDDEQLGVVQARWAHANPKSSALTGIQAMALDKHFIIEQTVRHRAALFPKFNGTAGIWRRSCLEAIGGWQADTLCEDLCASTRAFLSGWRFRFLPEVLAPAELPATISGYRSQQSRWAKGSTQCLRKYGWQILRSRQLPLSTRLYGLLTMASYATSLLVLLLLLLQIPLLYVNLDMSVWMAPLSMAGLGQPLLFLVSQKRLYADWKERIFRLPLLLLTVLGLSVTITRAVLQGALGHDTNFNRTPKLGSGAQPGEGYHNPVDWLVITELCLALYAGVGMGIALERDRLTPLFFMGACLLGLSYVIFLSVRENIAQAMKKNEVFKKIHGDIKKI
jgi:cellulose synthase/poly-beta-1,6-N-acetylglucosamine synthase-like glycosyltransferase